MSEENRCVVTLKKGVDTDKFMEDMKTVGYELHNEKPDSVSNFDYVMTKAQANNLKEQDPRIRDIRYGSKKDNGIEIETYALQDSIDFDKSSTVSGANWGLCASTFTADQWSGSSGSVTKEIPYTLTGKGVDVVIMDSGIDTAHPEWLGTPRNSSSGTTRYQTVNWPSISGLSGSYTQHADYHRDLTGHGTHVAGISCGKLNGWAKEANIYSLKILDDATTAFGVSAAFNMLKGFHNAKKAANSDDTSVPTRPTICNMSWGYFGTNTRTMTSVYYRGSSYTGSNALVGNGSLKQYGLIPYVSDASGYWKHHTRVTSVESDIEDCIEAGVILVSSAGNYQMQIDTTTGLDYDNRFLYTGWDAGAGNLGDPDQIQYYHRGSTPAVQDGVICVGAIHDTYTSNAENQAPYSNRGPRIDIYAPGSGIMSAIPNSGSYTSGAINYTLNSSYKVNKLDGTSMASPQVTGVLACVMQARHSSRSTMKVAEALDFVTTNAEDGRLYDQTSGTPSNDYDNVNALHGAPNRFLKQPFNSEISFAMGTNSVKALPQN